MQRLAQGWRREGIRIGVVPTMGYLHAGHLSLVQRARRSVGTAGRVVVSIYVNPTQFAPTEDLGSYPRDLARDTKLCRGAGVDVLFVPTDREMYPAAAQSGFSTYVIEQELSQKLEGTSRPTHFRGVTTVVAKLFNLVQPDVAIFGQKDFQQAAVVRRMIRDLNFPLRLIVAPTVRESDGLAMSSRNKYLSSEERRQAVVLWRSIQLARVAVKKSRTGLAAGKLRRRLVQFIQRQPAARVDYVVFFEPSTLQAVQWVRRGTQLALAVWVGRTRLIDNAEL